jgi:hypothetical protein
LGFQVKGETTMPADNDRFEVMFKSTFKNAPQHWRDSLTFVADTAFMCRLWLMDYAPGWTPSDLMKMTEMVATMSAPMPAREKELEERDNAEPY